MSVIKPYRFYSKAEIEGKALDLLMRMQRVPNFAPKWPFDASLVADFLDLGVVWDRIPPDEQGAIAARILPQKRQIEINEEILKLPKGFQESTLAHEIGHWILHVNQEEVDGVAKQLELIVCRGASKLLKIESIEWQAQYFATCLLMPRYVLEEKRTGRDLTKWADLYALAKELGVTISNLKHRLKDIGWIHIPQGSREIYLGTV
ncbi:MAG: ImmA/IrrE family metallo-endopeptidase [Oscillatoriaceae bacterium SKW80]|nr:ImmA/IrrE family metallo-endopeptidase [Oscillatoriaceae bacterium SKYG93]MCX8119327.1 ImmA/IrrE family metallo-endopeptidase [Oscillatoriaceae bacterium SKW80]MDW8454794.1 ImmA/IrrE family metallo-endopeptidase [Oscillatoriaceae cyanobacterium SKYGB_i_bin93]HIK28425.1 ImmA/IrrE family metallo-endopeptidase [Oscillatoriaceae cyanobacterium M7585_C2015_266]